MVIRVSETPRGLLVRKAQINRPTIEQLKIKNGRGKLHYKPLTTIAINVLYVDAGHKN